MSLFPDTPTTLSTAWMPLDGLAQQWGQFGSEASDETALAATSHVFIALAKETEARGWHALAADTLGNPLEHTLEDLVAARAQWSEALMCVKRFIGSVGATDASLHALALDVLEQRVRLSTLIAEVEREQLAATRMSVQRLEEAPL